MSNALSTDLYQLTMMAGYHAAGLAAPATFDLYVRALPPHRSFLVAAGLDQALEYLEQLQFSDEDIRYLRGLPIFRRARADFFDDYLPRFRFTGEVWALDEGTAIVPPEPLLRVTAPLPEAQIVETALLAHIGFQTSVATRAARIVIAAAGRPVAEFGARRAHGVEAGLHAARAAFVAGCDSTSNVLAGHRFDIPVSGTMAHSWVTAFADELAAFRAYADIYGPDTVLLLDTYDTLAAARAVVASGLRPRGVRIDSGDLVALSRGVRTMFDEAGLQETALFASGDLDEWRIAELVASGAPFDGFGVGSALSTVSDAPSLGAIYKLVEIDRAGRAVPLMKRSPGKPSLPGRKQIWRRFEDGAATGDELALVDEHRESPGEPLLRQVMSGGRRLASPRPLRALRTHALSSIASLPSGVRRLEGAERYPVRFSPGLESMIDRLSTST
jgi:nicotinate phosphoribosyltransferase